MGAEHPIVVQSMTNTVTANIPATVDQIRSLVQAGSEMVRITINDQHAAEAVPHIIRQLRAEQIMVPIVGDFHYNGHILLTQYPEMAEMLAKYRINPGNVGKGSRRDTQFAQIIQAAIRHQKPVRIGVNWGSLDPQILAQKMDANAALAMPLSDREMMIEAMLESALTSAAYAEELGLKKTQIVLSVKMSELQDMVTVYQRLAASCDYVLHLGLTEAGAGVKGLVGSAAALGILIQQGIGDTIRVSLTPETDVPRSREVAACKELLQAIGARHFRPSVTSCPGCGRTDSDYFIRLAADVNAHIEQKINEWRPQYPDVTKLKIAVMGCVVNGPGESKHANIGISLPGLRESPVAPVYVDGRQMTTLKGDHITQEFIQILDAYVRSRYESSTVSI